MRINARLDEEHSRKLEQLKATHQMGVSDILKRAIDLLYAQEAAAPKKKLSSLLGSELIGIGDAPENLASDYKQLLKADMASKHDSR